MTTIDVTIAICTWNRSRLLEQTLSSLERLKIPDDCRWEVVIIDNNSTDQTQEVIRRFAHSLPLRSEIELKQGHCHARNRAIQECRGALLLWTDDDVIVEPGWLAAYWQSFRVSEPKVAFFGGEVSPLFETPLSRIKSEAFPFVRDGYCGVGAPQKICIQSLADGLPLGVNFAVRTELARRFQFDTSFGKVADNQFSGDDLDFLRRLVSAGYEGRWVIGAGLQHFVAEDRAKLKYILNWYYELGRTTTRLDGTDSAVRAFGFPRWQLRKFCELVLGLTLHAAMLKRVNVLRGLGELYFLCGQMVECKR